MRTILILGTKDHEDNIFKALGGDATTLEITVPKSDIKIKRIAEEKRGNVEDFKNELTTFKETLNKSDYVIIVHSLKEGIEAIKHSHAQLTEKTEAEIREIKEDLKEWSKDEALELLKKAITPTITKTPEAKTQNCCTFFTSLIKEVMEALNTPEPLCSSPLPGPKQARELRYGRA